MSKNTKIVVSGIFIVCMIAGGCSSKSSSRSGRTPTEGGFVSGNFDSRKDEIIAQEEIIRRQKMEMERQQRELEELKRQKYYNERMKQYEEQE